MLFDSMLSRIVSLFSSDPIVKGVIIIGSGVAISQIFGIVFIPIITRLYPPAIYGTLAVFTSLLSILLVMSTFKYDFTISITEKDDDAEYLFILSLFIVSVLTIILFLILMYWGNYLAGLYHFEFIAPYYWLFCVGFFGSSLYSLLTYWNLRTKNYLEITKTKITQSVSGSVCKIFFGILSFGSLGLIGGEIIGRIVGIGTLGRKILPKIWVSMQTLDINKLKSLAYKYRKFPIFSLPSGIINEIALQIPTLFMASLFGFQIVGLYALSYSILVLPISLVSGSIEQVYIAESSELFRKKSDKILPLYLATTKKLFIYGAPVILIAAVLSPILFPLIFGNAWKDAGMFALPLSVMVIAQFVVSSTDRLDLYGYNLWTLSWNICRTFLVILIFYLALILKFTPIETIFLFSLTMMIMYGINYILNIKAIQSFLKQPINDQSLDGKNT